LKGLNFVENIQTSVQLIEKEDRNFEIDGKSLCPICNKIIGNSVFAVYPNMVVVHLYCYETERRGKKKY
jgi:hypothetical protein